MRDVSTPAISNRARRRTQKEAHGSVRTRPTSARLTTASKTPGVMSYHAWPSPCRPSLATVERGTRQLTDEERTQLATAARCAQRVGTPSIKELAREWRISPQAIYNIINRQRSILVILVKDILVKDILMVICDDFSARIFV